MSKVLRWVLIWSVFFPLQAQAIEVSSLAINIGQYFPGSYTPMVPAPLARLSLDLDLDFNEYIYMTNQIHGTTDKNGFRTVGWLYSFGARISNDLDFYYEHHSQHWMDQPSNLAIKQYPIEDSINLRLRLIGKNKNSFIGF